LALASLAAFLLCSAAAAAPPLPLAQVPEDGNPGSVAGRLDLPLGIAADQGLPGHIYVADTENARVDEFTAWGEFVKAWGWGVVNGEAKLQTCTKASGCQKGIEGPGSGQFNTVEAIAVDGAGQVYVVEANNHRVQKFDPTAGPEEDEAAFVLMFGRDVNKTKVEALAPEAQRNRCPVDPGDVCQTGIAGTGAGQLGSGQFGYRNLIVASPADNAIFVAEGARIQRFGAGGVFEEEIQEGCLAGKSVRALAADKGGNLYAALVGDGTVRKLKPHGPSAECLAPEFKAEIGTDRPKAVALDGLGNLYALFDPNSPEPARAQEYDPSGKCLTCGSEGEGGKPGFDRTTETQLFSIGASSACGTEEAYATHFSSTGPSFFRAFGEHPDPILCEPPKVPPSVEAQYPISVETNEALLQAKINPKFWSGSLGETTYYVQYGTVTCVEGGWESSCIEDQPLAPGQKLIAGVVNESVASTPVVLKGLTPDTAYRFRFVAQSTGGGPVYGIDPDGPEGPEEATIEDGLAGSFRTYRTPGIEEVCAANQAFRSGASAQLPDCRAYEMVSPLDKEGGDIVALLEAKGSLPAVLSQSALSGSRLAYGSYRSFGGALSGPYTTQYIAAREAGVGWKSHPISAPRGKLIYATGLQTDTEFRAFTADLCEGWYQSLAETPVDPLAPVGYSDLYRRSDEECGGPAYEALNRAVPPFRAPKEFQLELQGFSADGTSAVFIAYDALAEGASAETMQLYGAKDGAERFLCVLPGGVNYTAPCIAGGNTEAPVNAHENREANVSGALSEDGSKVYWTALKEGGDHTSGGPGKIYLRENPFDEGNECSGAGTPCTLAVSEAAETLEGKEGASQFRAAAEDGSRALFSTNGELYEYRLADESTHAIAGEFQGLMGSSADATRIYFGSKEALGGANGEGKSAVAGQLNLYFHEAGGTPHFVGELAAGGVYEPLAGTPRWHTSRVSPDGLHAVFSASSQMTDYDNTDAVSGKADAEVFVYDAAGNGGAGKLLCASCNPSGARPQGRFSQGRETAAQIPVFENTLYGTRALADEGTRLYFESFDALTPRDANGKKDVYQWEAAGAGGCKLQSPTYSPDNGGCIDLISTGQSKLDSEFIDASPSGNDVFFATLSSLVSQDFGLFDIYDARVDGGLPSPPGPGPECEGEGCQNPPPAPEFQTPSTATNSGFANVHEEGSKKPPCPKGKHRVKKNGKSRCVKNKKAKSPKRASHKTRRADR
jgi:hypothetical protein